MNDATVKPHTVQAGEITSVEGVTYTPWTDGWAIGFKVTHPDRPTVYVYLNPAGEVDTGEVDDSSVFLYHGPTGEPGPDDGPVSYVNMWDGPGAEYVPGDDER